MPAKTISIAGKDAPRDFIFCNFKVTREKWNKYKLSDNSILKTKFVLINIIAEKDYKKKLETRTRNKKIAIGIGIKSHNVTGIEAPENLRGKPAKKSYSMKELRSSAVEEDLDIEVIKETWNEYKLEDKGTIKIKNSPINVSRTNKYDGHGLPIYLIDFTADIKIKFKK